MKPTSLTARARFPFTDYNYHSGAISGYRSRCAKSVEPSFRNISRQYFQKEARRDFVGEAIVFAMLIITATVAVASGAQAAVQLCRALGAL
ncbi:MAG TPA: hypothetical protein VNE84_08245 [Candidatus Limnocylindria bacterium]|jgi:hypothetical protein|nr:hypothetical protein [Candidatus Limnocylindria bacterium]